MPTSAPKILELTSEGTSIDVEIGGREIHYRVASPGIHIALNSLAVAAAPAYGGADVEQALDVLSSLPPPPGRGSRVGADVAGGRILIIDETYNANPRSMRAALAVLGTVPRSAYRRRIAVLGDMLELGPDQRSHHLSTRCPSRPRDRFGLCLRAQYGAFVRGAPAGYPPGAWARTVGRTGRAVAGRTRAR